MRPFAKPAFTVERAPIEGKKPWKSKYKAQPVVITDDKGNVIDRFDSKREHQRYCVLKLMEKAGEIANLQRQVTYNFDHNGVHIGAYRADFTYFDSKTDSKIIEDCKGFETDVFKLKSKMMRAFYNITLRLS